MSTTDTKRTPAPAPSTPEDGGTPFDCRVRPAVAEEVGIDSAPNEAARKPEVGPLSARLRSAANRCTRFDAEVALLCEYAQMAADSLDRFEFAETKRAERLAEKPKGGEPFHVRW
jgi:hypothetical protein